MARFKETHDTLKAIAANMPTAMAAMSAKPTQGTATVSQADLERALMNLFQSEGVVPIRLSLMIRKLADKFSGRAV